MTSSKSQQQMWALVNKDTREVVRLSTGIPAVFSSRTQARTAKNSSFVDVTQGDVSVAKVSVSVL